MKAKQQITITLTLVLTALICMVGTGEAQTQESRTVSTYVGDISYQHQTITKASAEKIHRQKALSRASELVVWSMPVIGFYQAFKAQQENLNVGSDDLAIGLYEGPDAVRTWLTANVTTPYTVTVFDLSGKGPLVFEIPEGGVYGVCDNAWQEPIKEINSGKAEKLLIVGPGQDYPENFDGEIVQSGTFLNFLFYRVLGQGPEADALKTAVKAYKLSEAANPPKTRFIPFTPNTNDPIAYNSQPTDMGYWELVNEMVQKEQKEILLEGLKVGMAMAHTNSFNSNFPAAVYQDENSGWEWVLSGIDPKIDLETYSMYNERAAYTYEAVTTSAGMISKVEGKGSGYLGTYYDSDGNALLGENNYTLRLEPNMPAANFWSITVYDIEKRVVIRNKVNKADLSSRTEGLQVNDDGSVDLYFGPRAPAGKESNWIQTNPGESWFTYFRCYDPLKPFFEETYPMNKIQLVK